MLFVVAGATFDLYNLQFFNIFLMILRLRSKFLIFLGGFFALIELLSGVDFERYLSWPDIVCYFLISIRSLILTLFVENRAAFGGRVCLV